MTTRAKDKTVLHGSLCNGKITLLIRPASGIISPAAGKKRRPSPPRTKGALSMGKVFKFIGVITGILVAAAGIAFAVYYWDLDKKFLDLVGKCCRRGESGEAVVFAD